MAARCSTLCLLVALGLGCAREAEEAADAPATRSSVAAPAEAPSPAPRPALHRWRFELARTEIAVLDLGLERPLALPEGAALAINGGFWDRRGEPEGWVVAGGERLSGYDRALGGGVLVVDRGRAALFDGERFEAPAERPAFAIQAKPRLVVGGAVNIRSETGRRAARTALCVREGGRVLEVIVAPAGEGEGPTLLELAERLAGEGCEEALNLDG
ncbi:MAG TPA: phosphodiester glycosidase family protein, partial [Polyangiaceae bacterium LLY-WYZ-15_(1-7)]|nr:phosphodiester glycosidase family protein [Polyangiaceae bacterium LLY-WYZ-15_(1-7)]